MSNHNKEISKTDPVIEQQDRQKELLQKKILKERAKQLAEVEQQPKHKKQITVLAVQIASEKYSIENTYILTVIPLKDLTVLPGTPPSLIGIINVHGDIIAVFDIKKIFDIKESPQDQQKNKKIVVVTILDALYGILVDDLLGVMSVPNHTIQETLPTLTGIRSKYIKGITNDQMIILDPIKFVQDNSLIGNIDEL